MTFQLLLGVIIFEMLIGYRPFDPDCPPKEKEGSGSAFKQGSGMYDSKLIDNIFNGDLSHCKDDLSKMPPRAAVFIEDAIKKDKDDRYRDAGIMLEAFADLESIPCAEGEPERVDVQVPLTMQEWTEDQVCEFVTRCFPKFDASIFRDSGIDGELLLDMSDKEFVDDIGLTKLQTRRLRKEIEKHA